MTIHTFTAQVWVSVDGFSQLITTQVQAVDYWRAILLLEALYGKGSVCGTPTLA